MAQPSVNYPYIDPSVPSDTPEASTGLDVSQVSPNVAPPLPEDVAQSRAAKYDLALGEASPGMQGVQDALVSGGEEGLRQMSANQEIRKRWEAAVELFKSGEATVDGDTMNAVVDSAKKTVSPSSVLEKQYAEKALGLSLSLTNNPDEVNDANTPHSQALYDFYARRIADEEIYLKAQEDADAAISTLIPGYGAHDDKFNSEVNVKNWTDFATSAIPFHTWNTMSTKELGELLSSWLPGNNRAEQYDFIHGMRTEDKAILIPQIMASISARSPTDAAIWAHGLTDYSAIAAEQDNTFGLLDIASIVPIVKGGKVISGTTRRLSRLVEGTADTKQALAKAKKGAEAFKKAAEQANHVPAFSTAKEAETALTGLVDGLQSKRKALMEQMIVQGRDGNTAKAAVLRSVLEKTTQDVADLEKGIAELKAAPKNKSGPLVERLRRTALAVQDPALGVPEKLSASGHLSEAARMQAKNLVEKTVPQAGKTMKRDIADLMSNTPSLYSPVKKFLDAADASKLLANRLADFMTDQEMLTKALGSVVNVSRLTPEAREIALDAAEAEIKKQFTQAKHGALVTVEKFKDSDNPLTNTSYVEAVFGKPDGTFFESAQKALNHGRNRYGMDISERDVFQEGDGYAIRIRKDVDETSPTVRDALISLDNGSNTAKNKLLGIVPIPKSISSTKDTVSKFQAEQRAAMTHATVARQMFLTRMMEPASKLSKVERKALDTIMAMNRDAGGGSARGKFFQNGFELDQAYIQKFDRLATPAEKAAYEAFVKASDADYIFRAVEGIKVKARQGIERMTMSAPGKDGKAFSFEGKIVNDLPYDSKHPGSVFYAPDLATKGKYYRLSEIKDDLKKQIRSGIENKQLTIVQTYNPEDEAIRAGLKVSGPVNFVVTKTVKREAIRFDEQLPYRPGFHVKYKDDFFIKQPKIYYDSSRRRVYAGDVVALGVSNSAKAGKEVQLLERARQAVKAKDDVAIAGVIGDGLPLTVSEVKKMFKTTFDVDTPFAVVKNGQSSIDVIGSRLGQFDDFANSPFNLAKDLNAEFIGHKDSPLWAIKNTGTEDAPVWEMGTARTVDPIETQIEAMGRLIRSTHYNDYQIGAAESWVQEFGVQKSMISLNGRTVLPDELRRNPGFYLAHGKILGTGAEADTARVIQRAVRNLVSHKSLIAGHLSQFQASLLASGYERSGEKFVETIDNWSAILRGGLRDKASVLAYKGAEALLHDLPSKLRAIAFHTKLGLGNPVQVMLQSQTLMNIGAISPKHGPNATLVSAWMRRLDLIPGDDSAVRAMAQKASKITPGWTSDEFVESYNLLKKTGFDLIGGDLSWRNDIADPKIFQGSAGKALEWSAGFFNGTERFVRMASWNTAYKEYIEKFPRLAGKLDNDAAKTILSRAQDLSGNMTRDAHAFWQEGAASTVTQFWGYTARMFDLMTGMRLTPAEKARLFTGWAALYGLPVAGTAVAPFWPLKDTVREQLLAHETNPDEGLVGLVMNGAASTALAVITGTHYDIGDRLGPSEVPVIKTLVQPRYGQTPLDAVAMIAAGASGSIAANILQDTSPVIRDLTDLVSGQGNTTMMMQDVNDLFSNVSSYNNIQRGIAVYNTGLYTTKDDRTISSKHDPFDGVWLALTGIQTTDPSNARAMANLFKQEQDMKTQARNDMKEYLRLYFASMNAGDQVAAQRYMKGARGYAVGAGLTEKEIKNVIETVRSEKSIQDTSLDKYEKYKKEQQ